MKFRHPAEKTALHFLERCGHQLLHHNYHARFCEIDLITLDDKFTLHFTEVKNWQSQNILQHPLKIFNNKRRKLLHHAAQKYMAFACKNTTTQEYLSKLCCPHELSQLELSFNLLWLCSHVDIKYYPQIF